MSILLIGLSEELTEELVKRLIHEGDEVRVLEDSNDNAESWRRLGAHIAHGPIWDADLIERAAQKAVARSWWGSITPTTRSNSWTRS